MKEQLIELCEKNEHLLAIILERGSRLIIGDILYEASRFPYKVGEKEVFDFCKKTNALARLEFENYLRSEKDDFNEDHGDDI